MEMEPEGCGGLEVEDRLAATPTLMTYRVGLAWIGMVLAHPEFHGRGFASRLVQHALSPARLRGISRLRLDATESGAAIYSKLGFALESTSLPPGKVLSPSPNAS